LDIIESENKKNYLEFPKSINHKNFNYYAKPENENSVIFELILNRIKETDDNINFFYYDLKNLYYLYFQNQKISFENQINLRYSKEQKSLNCDEIIDFRNLFCKNRRIFRQRINYFLKISFPKKSKQIEYFIDNLIFTFNEYDKICNILEEFLKYLEKNFEIEQNSINIVKKYKKYKIVNY